MRIEQRMNNIAINISYNPSNLTRWSVWVGTHSNPSRHPGFTANAAATNSTSPSHTDASITKGYSIIMSFENIPCSSDGWALLVPLTVIQEGILVQERSSWTNSIKREIGGWGKKLDNSSSSSDLRGAEPPMRSVGQTFAWNPCGPLSETMWISMVSANSYLIGGWKSEVVLSVDW